MRADRRSLLVVGGAGGVGSMAIQIARKLTGLTVVATASRPETQAWVRQLGAHHVIDHTQPFAPQLAAVGFPAVDIVLALTGTAQNAGQIGEVIAPEGHLGLIEGAAALKAFDTGPLFSKSVGVHLELMFTRSTFGTASMIEQHRLLTEIADLVDRGAIRTTLREIVGPIDAAHLKQAHALVESGKAIGKVVLAGVAGGVTRGGVCQARAAFKWSAARRLSELYCQTRRRLHDEGTQIGLGPVTPQVRI